MPSRDRETTKISIRGPPDSNFILERNEKSDHYEKGRPPGESTAQVQIPTVAPFRAWRSSESFSLRWPSGHAPYFFCLLNLQGIFNASAEPHEYQEFEIIRL